MMNNYFSLSPDLSVWFKLLWQKKMAMLLFFVLFSVLDGHAQIGVTIDNPTNTTPNLAASYPSLALALTDLNAVSAMSGPVTLTLAAGSEVTPPTGLAIGSATLNPVLSAVNTVTLVASGTVMLNAGVGTATPGSAAPDGLLKIIGADWVTIDGLTFIDANVANPATMEFGIGLFKLSLSDGALNNTIKNCIIIMQRVNNATGTSPMVDGSVGILMINATDTAAITALVPTTAAGSNSNNKFFSNTINGGNIGMALIGYAASTPFTAADTNNDIGGGSLTTGNSILNFGGGAVTNPAAGIRTLAQYGINVSYNTVNNNNGSGVNHGTTLRGIYLNTATSASATVNNNIVTVKSAATTSALTAIDNASGATAASNTITINNNTIENCAYLSATSGTFTGVLNSASAATVNINGNSVSNNALGTVGTAGSCIFQGIYNSAGLVAQVFSASSNTILNNSVLNSYGNFYGIRAGTQAVTCNLNTISNITFPNGASTNTIAMYGIYDLSLPTTENYTNNTISNFTVSGSNTSTSSAIYGIISNTVATSNVVYSGNTISGFTFNNSSTGSAVLRGISLTTAATVNIFKNKIFDFNAAGPNSTATGIFISGGTTSNTYNNIIGNLSTPTANLANPLIGINITGGTTANVYYNTVYLNGSSTGALFGSSAISVATGPTTDLRNNIFVNNSAVSGAGLAVAYRRSTSTLSSYATTSNNNLFYASNIFTDGTNTDATLLAFKTRMATRDMSSVSENPNFVSTIGSNLNFLHINTAIGTLIESGAATIATFTDDFDGNVRNVSTPDIGADEFAGIPLSVVVINSVAIDPIGNQCIAVSRTVTANITAGSNDITSVTLNYSFNGSAPTPVAMTGGTLTAGTTSTFTGIIPVAVPANANVTWNVTATDPLNTKVTSGTSYQDEPLLGYTANATASISTICNGGSTVLSATLLKNGLISVGSGSSTTTGSGTSSTNYVSPFTHWWGGYKAQYIMRASELSALGFSAGTNLTSLAFDVTTAGGTYTGFTLRMGATAATVMTSTFDTASLTQVYTGDLAVSTTGLMTLPFGTGTGSSASFTWDGTSNVLINLCWSNNNTGGGAAGSAEVKYDATSFVAMAYYRADNATPTTLCSVATATATSSNRPKMVFGGIFGTPISSISWSDGSTVVGTGNNLSVSPTVNTTYTATITASGCTIDTNAVAVTVNTTAAPTGSAAQTFCNAGTVANLVATGSGIQWYAGSTGGAPLASTIALVDGVHYFASQTVAGCESATRLDVMVTVNNTPEPTGSASQTFCNAGTVANLVATGTGVQWYAAAIGGAPLASTDVLVDGAHYFASQTVAGCESATRLDVTVTVTTTPAPTGAASQTFVTGQMLSDIVVTGSNIVWYASSADAATANNPLPNTTLLVDTITYYATQTIAGCASTSSLAVTVTVNLGVADLDSNSFSFYPNPVKNVLNLSYSQEMTNVKAFNLMGQQVLDKNINATTAQIDMAGLSNGAYFIKVTSGKTTKTIKVIKN